MLNMRLGLFLFVLSPSAYATDSETMEVTGKRYSWLDTAQTASEGEISHEQLKEKPILRPGEIMESVPGLITTQHSGTGKANQYFLRGFNLDHGTDFATFVDGLPINMPSHGHGQGYTDVNFLVPELLEKIEYSKGPYKAAYGNFSGVGHIEIKTMDAFPQGLVKYTFGSYDYHRLLAMDSVPAGDNSQLSYAIEGTSYKGPWSDIDENLRKKLAWVKYVQSGSDSQHSITLQHYDGTWNSADQIPARAVEQGLMNRLGSIDRTTGGITQRDSLNWIWEKRFQNSHLRLQLYGVGYALNLWSNASYFLEDPIGGDQYEQEDRRSIFGGSASYSQKWQMGAVPGTLILGLQDRHDRISHVGLYKSIERRRQETKGESALRIHEIGVFVEQSWQWTSSFHSTVGLRHDTVQMNNKDKIQSTREGVSASITSPKLTSSYRLTDDWQVFASGGQSFHSNDARGVTAKEDPAQAFVPVRGYEVGGRFDAETWARVSLAIWRLHLDSELVFIGDAGTTEDSRASRREGIDWLLQLSPSPVFHADLELSWARARFASDPDGEGDRVEGHLPFVSMLSLGSQLNKAWSMSARFRHFGKRPLTADGTQHSQPTSLLNLHLAHESGDWEWAVDALNVLNSRDHDIDYYYESQLADETEPVADLHFHPVEPASLRFNIARRF